jgi:hypothetical protein
VPAVATAHGVLAPLAWRAKIALTDLRPPVRGVSYGTTACGVRIVEDYSLPRVSS